MAIYFLVTSLGLFLFACAIGFLIWLIRQGQLDDLDTPALRMLHDDPAEPAPPHAGSTRNAAS